MGRRIRRGERAGGERQKAEGKWQKAKGRNARGGMFSPRAVRKARIYIKHTNGGINNGRNS